MIPVTLSVTFTYDHLKGTFTGILPNGTSFEFVAAMEATLPIKLRFELTALAYRAVDMAKQRHEAMVKTINSPTLTSAEHAALLEAYLAKGGLVQKCGVQRQPKAQPSLEALGLDSIDLLSLDI